MSEMLVRLTARMALVAGQSPEDVARAALKELRVPTSDMVHAAILASFRLGGASSDTNPVAEAKRRKKMEWETMIDEALR